MPANVSEGGLFFKSGVDTSKFRADIRLMENDINRLNSTVRDQAQETNQLLGMVGRAMAAYFSVQTVGGFLKDMAKVRGEFQQLDIALETMIGNKKESDALLREMVEFTAKTPFELGDVGKGVKMLSAIRVETQNIIPTLKALGDVSAGLSIPLERLVLNYGQVKTQNQLMSKDLRDFQVMGIDMLGEIARAYGKTTEEVENMYEAGKITFTEVEKAFVSMTSTGGKFENLMFKQSASITGQVSNLNDNITQMMNNLGEANEALIYRAISGANGVVENYQEILAILKAVALTYGTYRAALLGVMVAEKIRNAMVLTTVIKNGEKMITVTRHLTLAQLAQAKASKIANAAMAVNPYVAIATAIAMVITGLMAWKASQKDLTEKVTEGNEKLGDLNDRLKELENIRQIASKYDTLKTKVGKTADEVQELADATNELVKSGIDLTKVGDSMSEYVDKEVSYIQKLYDGQLKQQREYYNELLSRKAELERIFDTGKETKTGYAAVGTGGQVEEYFIEDDVSEKKMQKYLQEWEALKVTIVETATKIGEVEENLKKLGGETPVVDKNKEYWEGERDRVQGMIDKLKTDQSDFNQQKASLEKEKAEIQTQLDKYKTQAQETGKAEKTELDKLEEYQKKYEQYYNVVRQLGKEYADEQYSQLLKEGKDFEEFLDKKLNAAVTTAQKIAVAQAAANAGITIGQKEMKPIESIKATGKMFAVTVPDAKTLAPLDNFLQKNAETIAKLEKGLMKEKFEEIGEATMKSADIMHQIGDIIGEVDKDLGNAVRNMADLVGNLGSFAASYGTGNVFGMISSGVGVIGSLFQMFKGSESKGIENSLERINRTLERQSAILASMPETADYFNLAKQQAEDFAQQLSINEEKLRGLIVGVYSLTTRQKYEQQYQEWSAKKWNDYYKARIAALGNYSSDSIRQAREYADMMMRELNYSIDKFIAEHAPSMIAPAQFWDLDKIIEEWSKGNLHLDEAAKAALDELLRNRKAYQDFLAETWDKVTGTTRDSITDSIIEGFRNGYRSAEDFADNFEDLMRGAIIKLLKTQMLQGAMTEWYEGFFEMAKDGLTEEEIVKQKEFWDAMIATQRQAYEAMEAVTGMDLDYKDNAAAANGLVGQLRAASEQSVTLLAGQLMAMREDLKAIRGYDSQRFETLELGVSHLAEIEKHTSNLYRLTIIEGELKEMNKTLKAKL